MVGEYLVVFNSFVSGGAVEPARKALVKLRSELFGNGVVGRVPDQHVAEPKRIITAEERLVRLDELLASERDQRRTRPETRRGICLGLLPSQRTVTFDEQRDRPGGRQ